MGKSEEYLGAKYVILVDPTTGLPVSPSDGDTVVEIKRNFSTVTVTVANNAYLSGVVDMRGWAGFAYRLSAIPTAAEVAWMSSDTEGGTYNPVDDAEATPALVQQVAVAQRWISAPVALFPLGFIRFWFQNAEVNAAQAGGLEIRVQRKG